MRASPYATFSTHPLRGIFGILAWPRTYTNLVYLLIGFPLGLAYFVFYVVGGSLGIGLATGRPAIVLCTSGTAAANFHPAVLEAAHARVPLLVLTADRPPELRDTGAGQTIDQAKLYGDVVRWYSTP